MIDELMIRALLAGLGVAVVAGGLGCFLVWRRMAFYGDTLSHSALLGVAFGLLAGVSPAIGALCTCVLIGALYSRMDRLHSLPSDTLLSVIAHGTLAAGIIAVTLFAPQRTSIESYLFGDLLTVSNLQLVLILAIGLFASSVAALSWRCWLSIAVDEELARVEGINVDQHKLIQMLVIAAVVAVAMNVVGALLVTALLVIPAASARAFARSPEQVAGIGSVVAAIGVCGGVGMSWYTDSPVGPSVVLCVVLEFVALHTLRHLSAG